MNLLPLIVWESVSILRIAGAIMIVSSMQETCLRFPQPGHLVAKDP